MLQINTSNSQLNYFELFLIRKFFKGLFAIISNNRINCSPVHLKIYFLGKSYWDDRGKFSNL